VPWGWRPPAIAVDSAPALVLTALYLPGATDAEPAWVVLPLALAQTLPLALRRVRPVEVAARAADTTGGFTFMVCALKALLEHDVVLTVVLDAHPQGLQL
jgi:hypothetical protein